MNDMTMPPLVPHDTTPEAARVYWDVLRRMSPERRVEMCLQMHHTARACVEAGVRQRHPEYNDEEVRQAVMRVMLGPELFDECHAARQVSP